MDWDKVFNLLHIAEKAQQWSYLHWLRDAAMKELAAMKEPVPEPDPGPRAVPAEDMERKL